MQGGSPDPNGWLLLWLPGVAFGLALTSASACILGFQPRQLLIIPYALAGWFCAALIYAYVGSIGTVLGTSTFAFYIVEGVVVFVAGGVGALITALGIPVATGRVLARYSYLGVMLTGALVGVAWGAMAIMHVCEGCYVELWGNLYVLGEIVLFWGKNILFPFGRRWLRWQLDVQSPPPIERELASGRHSDDSRKLGESDDRTALQSPDQLHDVVTPDLRQGGLASEFVIVANCNPP